jgi:hypothetical protein
VRSGRIVSTAVAGYLTVSAMSAEHDVLRKFSEGRITRKQAMALLYLRDYASLLALLGDAHIPLPTFPRAPAEPFEDQEKDDW